MLLQTAFIALGANLGDPPRMLADTVHALAQLHVKAGPSRAPVSDAVAAQANGGSQAAPPPANQTENVSPTEFAVSALYRSAPFQADGPDYYNAVVRLRTDLSPEALLTCLQSLENAGGRVRSTVNAPRTLDLDLLLHGQALRNTPQLTLPHPRMHERAFVLRPMMDLHAGDLLIPGVGTVAQCEALTRGQRIEKMPSPWIDGL